MSNLEIIERLCELLGAAARAFCPQNAGRKFLQSKNRVPQRDLRHATHGIIKAQAALLEMHGVGDSDGDLERRRAALLADVESTI